MITEVNFWGDTDITYRATEFWLGKSFTQMRFDDYAFASGMLQAEALTEYIRTTIAGNSVHPAPSSGCTMTDGRSLMVGPSWTIIPGKNSPIIRFAGHLSLLALSLQQIAAKSTFTESMIVGLTGRANFSLAFLKRRRLYHE